MHLFDTHTHLDDEQFDDIRDEVIQRAREAGVYSMIVVGTNAATSRKCVEIAAGNEGVFAAVGIQPNYAHEATDEDWEEILRLAEDANVVAIGETGLDRYWDFAPFPIQQEYFGRHIELSQQSGLPFIVHMRDCDADVLEMLRAAKTRGPLAGVMHSFSGMAETVAECIQLGMSISFAGMVTYKKSDELRAIAKQVPADRLLIETDCPYLSPHPKRGHRPNEPALIEHTARCLAEVRGETIEELAVRTTENAKKLFNRIN
jgi:TatD DNase family protein